MNFSDKTLSQIQHDVEETLLQYVNTLILFSQVQNKSEKDEVLHELNTFLFPVGYSVENMGYKIAPIYKGVFDRIRFKKSGWELLKV